MVRTNYFAGVLIGVAVLCGASAGSAGETGGATAPAAASQRSGKPAVLFLSAPLQMFYGGAFLRQNMARLDQMGYRVTYLSYPDVYQKGPQLVQSFDVVVMLDVPPIDASVTKDLPPETRKLHDEMRKLLAAGGGLMVFNAAQAWGMRSFDALMDPYGIHPLTGCLADENPVVTTYGVLLCAYTTEIATHPLARGVRGFWYPVGMKKGEHPDFDTLRNANTVPFAVDGTWTVLAGASPTTSFFRFGAEQGMGDPWLLQERFTQAAPRPAPLVAVREGAEGHGRLAACAVNAVFSDFFAGNAVYNGICTGKGVEGKTSDMDRLLMNILDWLGEDSMRAGRATMKKSDRDSFAVPPFNWPDPLPVSNIRRLRPNEDQFRGIVGVRSRYSGGQSTVGEYAETARKLGIQYLVFLEDFASLDRGAFERFKAECEAHSDDKLVLLPGIRIQCELGLWYFGFRKGITLPAEEFLKPGTRKLTHRVPQPGQYLWARNNGARYEMALGNFRLEEKTPSGVPPEDYRLLNPFISLYTYRNGELADTMLDTYLKCAERTEWVSPLAVHLIDSTKELRREWNSDHFKTVYLRDPGEGLAGFNKDIGGRYAEAPIAYVTNGPKIEEWRSSGFSSDGGWWDWTRYSWFVRMGLSSETGLKEVRVMDGRRLIRRFLPEGAKRFEHTLVLTHNDMHNLILIITDMEGRQAFSAEEWDQNLLFDLDWCSDRSNIPGGYSELPAPKAASGSTAGNYPAQINMEKGGFRENLVVGVNMDRSRLPGFDGSPYRVAFASPAPVVIAAEGTEGDDRIDRDIGRDLASPDVVIATAGCRLVYDEAVVRPHPDLMGPLVPMNLFQADLRYITFSHADHLPAPLMLEGRIRFLRDLSFKADGEPIGVRVLTLSTSYPAEGYEKVAIMHSPTGDFTTPIAYAGEPTQQSQGAFSRGTYAYFYPGSFGSVAVMSLDDHLSYRYFNKYVQVGYDVRGKTFKAGDELNYRLLVITSGFDEPPTTRLPDALRDQLGMNEQRTVGYTVDVEHGDVVSREYLLRVDGKGIGFAGEVSLPANFPVSLPIVVESLNDKWTSVLYDRAAKKLRPLGMHDNKAYCHRAPPEQGGRIFMGHPFTLSKPELWLSVVQTGKVTLTLQIHNPTDHAASVRVRRTPFFDFVSCEDFEVEVPAGRTVEYVLTGGDVRKAL